MSDSKPLPHRVILDCDPGIDDAIALLLALGSPEEIDLLGVTIVAGNVGLTRTVGNALRVMELAGRSVPIHAGADRPLMKPLIMAPEIHGESGLRGADLPEPKTSPAPMHAVDYLRNTLRSAAPKSITLCAVAPLTNLALAFATEPGITAALDRIVIMGGAMGLGNVTPSAEFNIHVDPQAASIVFGAGVPITLVPLDLTHQAIAHASRITRIQALGTPVARAVSGILSAYPAHPKFGGDGGPVHDACAVAALIRPGLMSGRECKVAIDLGPGPSEGRTVVDWWGKYGNPETAQAVRVLDRIDADGFFELLTERLARF